MSEHGLEFIDAAELRHLRLNLAACRVAPSVPVDSPPDAARARARALLAELAEEDAHG